MTLKQKKNGDILTIIPEGRLDSSTSGEFAEYIEAGFTGDIKKLVLDFSGVDFISSKGLRVIVSVYKGLDGRAMEINGANNAVMEIFRLSGLLKVIEVK